MAKLSNEEAMQKMSGWLAQTYGARLQSLIAYGSAAGGSHSTKFSDVNLLAVLDCLDAETLDAGAEAVRWWTAQGHPAPVFLSRDEQDDSADIFPIEYLDIQQHHRLLQGEDLFAAQPRYPEMHRRQVEHDLRAKLIRLRSGYMRVRNDAKQLERMMLESLSTFLTLFRHALVALGEPFRVSKDDVLAASAARFGFDPAPLAAMLDTRRAQGARLAGGKLDTLRPLFSEYLRAIQKVERALED